MKAVISIFRTAQACQNNLPVPRVLESLSLKPLSLRKESQAFFKSQHNTHSLHLHVTLQKFMMCDSELKDHCLCSRKLIPFFLWCCWGYPTILLSSACSPKHDSEGANNSHRTEQLNFCCHIGRREECLKVLHDLMLPVHFFSRAKGEPGTSVLQILVPLFGSKT